MTTPTRQLSDACFFTWLADLSLEEPGLGSVFSLRALTLPRVGLPEGGHVGRAFPQCPGYALFLRGELLDLVARDRRKVDRRHRIDGTMGTAGVTYSANLWGQGTWSYAK